MTRPRRALHPGGNSESGAGGHAMAVRNDPTPTQSHTQPRENSRERADRYPADTFLREHGFKIHSRPKTGPAVWERHGVAYPHDEAVTYARALRDRAIKELESKSTDLP